MHSLFKSHLSRQGVTYIINLVIYPEKVTASPEESLTFSNLSNGNLVSTPSISMITHPKCQIIYPLCSLTPLFPPFFLSSFFIVYIIILPLWQVMCPGDQKKDSLDKMWRHQANCVGSRKYQFWDNLTTGNIFFVSHCFRKPLTNFHRVFCKM